MKKSIILTSMLGLTLALTSCSDVADEITSLVVDRNFSPIDFEAKSIGEDKVTLSWTASSGATSYTVEVFADDSLTFAGTAAQTITGITPSETSVNVTGLVYDTQYSARVMALDENDESRNSKWSKVYFRTSAQQIFETVETQDVGDRNVTLKWPAEDTDVNTIEITSSAGEVVSYTITDEDKAAGQATISGLTPETDYTAKLYSNGKERGSKTFKTIIDLNGATVVRSDEDIAAILEAATEGQVFALYNDTYTIASEKEGEAGCVTINKSITIKGIYPTDKAVLKGRFQLEDGAGLIISNLILDGTDNATADQAFNYKTADVTYGPLDIQESEIKGFSKGFYYVNVAATIEKININNNVIHDIVCDGGDMFDCRKGYIDSLKLTNNTIYNCAQNRDFVRYDDAASNFGNPVPVIVVSNNTFDNILNETSAKRLLYVRFNGKDSGQDITWSNNLITNTQAVYTNQSTTSTPKYSNNVYYNCTNKNIFAETVEADKAYWNGDTSGSNGDDPQYKDPDNGDFTIGNESVSKLKVGDPRWY